MHVEMSVFGFALDPLAKLPVVILKDHSENTVLPVWISSGEAVSIAAELVGRDNPVTDGKSSLLSRVLALLRSSIVSISIDRFDDGLFSASLTLTRDGEEMRLDVRPAEAVGVSLRFGLPVKVALEVVEQASRQGTSTVESPSDVDPRRYVDFLERLDPADLGKYPL